jgi:hypothetical protein
MLSRLPAPAPRWAGSGKAPPPPRRCAAATTRGCPRGPGLPAAAGSPGGGALLADDKLLVAREADAAQGGSGALAARQLLEVVSCKTGQAPPTDAGKAPPGGPAPRPAPGQLLPSKSPVGLDLLQTLLGAGAQAAGARQLR